MNEPAIPPALSLKRFTCPSCNQLSEQAWFNAYAHPVHNPAGVPLRIAGADLERLSRNPQFPDDVRAQKVAYWNRVNGGAVFVDRWAPVQSDVLVAGMEISVCHACMAAAVWLGGTMVYPLGQQAVNTD